MKKSKYRELYKKNEEQVKEKKSENKKNIDLDKKTDVIVENEMTNDTEEDNKVLFGGKGILKDLFKN